MATDSSATPRPRPRRVVYLLPNLLTTGAMFAGFYAIVAAINGDFTNAVIAIFVAGLLDGLDGRVARLTNTQSEFGVQYDSLSDLVSFGVAPALVLFVWSLKSLGEYGPAWGKFGWAAAFIFAACGALRLARFNTQVGTADKRWFVGLAIPAGAGVAMSFVWTVIDSGHAGKDVQFVTPVIAIVTGLLMISRFRYFSFKAWPRGDKVPFVWVPVILLILFALIVNTAVVLCAVAFTYALSGPAMALWSRLRGRREPSQETPAS
jgi:CDP-diacylglycerol--serine O-phosphatidyltransferase